MTMGAAGALLPVEIVDDIVYYTLSSSYWSYFIDGQIIYQKNGEIRYHSRSAIMEGNGAQNSEVDLPKEWDPIVAMSGINVMFRDRTLQIGSRLLGIPRAVDGR